MADRLTALDAAFLDLDHPDAPLHVGATLRLDGPAPTLAGLRHHLDGRLDRAPRLRRRVLRADGLGLSGDAVWVDDPGFDIGRHVHEVTLPTVGAGGPDAALAEIAGVLLGTALEPGRPLWRMYLVRGVPGGWGLVVQIHHVLLDGVAAMTLAGLLLDLEPAPEGGSAPSTWRPDPAPGILPNAAASVRQRAADGLRAGAGALHGLRDPGTVARELQAAAGAFTTPMAATSLDANVGRERVIAFARAPLADVREAGRRHNATVNDVLLAATSLALGRALERRGELVDGVRVLVPVNVRTSDDDAFGNRISFLACDLPVAVDDPVRVLRRIRRQMHERKVSGQARPLAAIARAADALPSAGRRQLTRAIAARVGFTAIVSNVPGPPMPLYLKGSRLRSAYPAVPIMHGRALTLGALSYDGTLHIGLYADAGIIDDLPAIAADVQDALEALHTAVRPAPTPWQQRARDRRSA